MKIIKTKFQQNFAHEIFIGENSSYDFLESEILKSFSKVVFVADKTVLENNTKLKNKLKNFSVYLDSFSEEKKEKETFFKILEFFLKENIDRKSLVVGIGGGVLADLLGFACSTFKRGVGFAFFPTTLLAQVDAGIGGKTGINFKGIKNMLGSFYPANYVVVDVSFLETLPERIFIEGFGEVLKYAFIKNKKLLQMLEENSLEEIKKNKKLLQDIIYESIKTKVGIAEKDPYEKGLRRILNFGHTAGHAFEALSMNSVNPLKHGEAVSWGMLFEAVLSHKLGYLAQADLLRLKEMLEKYHLLDYSLPSFSFEDFWQKALQDKKNVGGEVKFVLLKSLGEAVYDISVNKEFVKDLLEGFMDANFKK